MASERQIAANRRNASKSTGPKSSVGKKRAARNASRHGLSISNGVAQDCESVEALARRIAGGNTDMAVLEDARVAARAELDLARIRALELAMIDRVAAFGALEVMPLFRSIAAKMRYVKSQPFDRPLRWPERVDPLGPMPSQEPERSAEAVRRLLPELRKLHRYERRAFTARDRALREISLTLRNFA